MSKILTYNLLLLHKAHQTFIASEILGRNCSIKSHIRINGDTEYITGDSLL